MSEKINLLHSKWKSIESLIRGTPLTYKGHRVEDDYVFQALTMLIVVWDDCVPQSPLSSQFNRWWSYVRKLDLFDLIDMLVRTGDHILQLFEQDVKTDYDSFKHCQNEENPHWGAICGPIRTLIAGAIKGNPDSLRRTLQCLWFLKKLNIKSDTLEDEALQKYLDAEHDFQPLEYTLEEKEIIERWFPKSDATRLYEKARPHHGNGATRDAGSDLMSKYTMLRNDRLLSCLCKSTGVDTWPVETIERCSRVSFVPKSYKTYRTISAEPASLMWYQEGFQTAIREYIREAVPDLSRRYDPFDQVPNQLLAQDGSTIYRDQYSMVTVDLSAASDSITRWLVKAWFSTSSLYLPMRATRSYCTELPNGEKIRLKKFAPMGNGLTFDVESITFAAIAVAAIMDAGVNPKYSRFRVYGDDIVIEKKFYPFLAKRLERNGFKLNSEKSFVGTGPLRFRESCGEFFLNGYNVTPLFLSKFFNGFGEKGRPWQPQAIDLCNLCEKMQVFSLRRWILSRYLLNGSTPPPIFSDQSNGVWSTDPTNYHLVRKWDKGLQCAYYVNGGLVTHYGEYDDYGEVGEFMLYEWLRLAEERPNRDLLQEEPVIVPRPLVQSASCNMKFPIELHKHRLPKGCRMFMKSAVEWTWKKSYL